MTTIQSQISIVFWCDKWPVRLLIKKGDVLEKNITFVQGKKWCVSSSWLEGELLRYRAHKITKEKNLRSWEFSTIVLFYI